MKPKKLNILFAEDDKIDQLAIERFIREKNLAYDYKLGSSVSNAQNILQTKKFDIIFADYMLGDGTAFDLFEAAGETPVIIVTGTGDEAIAVKAMKAGAYDYLIKDPYGNYLHTLPIVIENALKHKQIEVELENHRKHLEELVQERTAKLRKEITERERAQADLRNSEEKYRTLIEQSGEAIYLIYNSRFEIVNQKFTAIFGITLEQANSPKFDFMDLVHPESKPLVEERMLLLANGKQVDPKYEYKALNCKNQTILMEATITQIKYQDGVATQGIIRDITEKRKLEEQLQHAQKMESIGTLAGGVAHDFNNLLTIINGYSEMCLLSLKDNDPLYKKVDEIKKAGGRAENLTRQLLAFSRKQIYNAELTEINTVIHDMDKMLHRLISEDINITTALSEKLPLIKADKSQLEQIFMNLVVNASDAVMAVPDLEHKKKITIETGIVVLDKNYVSDHSGSTEGSHIFFSVSDNGIGMDEATKLRIFEPFFTTKDKFKGTGLGLSMVYGIVKQNNGSVYAYSEPGVGTTFKIYWPVTEQKEMFKSEEFIETKNLSGKESILLVEDNPEVCKFAKDALTSLGYAVYDKPNGMKAFEFMENKKHKLDLIVTDLVMPELNGREFVDKIKVNNPDIKVIFVSGYTDNHIVHNGLLEEKVNFVQKPYSVNSLAQKVRLVLDKG